MIMVFQNGEVQELMRYLFCKGVINVYKFKVSYMYIKVSCIVCSWLLVKMFYNRKEKMLYFSYFLSKSNLKMAYILYFLKFSFFNMYIFLKLCFFSPLTY